ncbi:MAG: Asp23/Gls24 family envelope stress response protein [Lachnospiraceae bacterium]
MKGHMTTKMGDIIIENDVIAKYAGKSAMECFGIVGMASVSVKDGIVKLLTGNNMTKGIKVTIDDNKIEIDFHVIVAYGSNITAITDNLVDNVKYRIEALTGMTVQSINIFVEGVRVIDN